ncbi:MAG: competence/damage-inducible protein A [Bacteroidota bacterium]|jgi:nicotinamide-nucleotide amidase
MRADIISIGDELLIGQTVNTNASWLGNTLSSKGVRIVRVTSVSDDRDEIVASIDESLKRSDLLIITGGLGPTKDDITKHTLCDYFGTKLVMHQPTLEKIEAFFTKRNRPMLDVNRDQAMLPVDCEILNNANGTAAGMWFEKNGKIVISLPGVPFEMKGIMENEVFPRLSERYRLDSLFHRTIMTQGIGESFLADKIKDWEDRVRDAGLGLAYLPSPGQVKLRLTSYEGDKRNNEIDRFFKELERAFPQYVYGYDDVSLQEVVGDLLRSNGLTIGTAESCTGGMVAGKLTSVPGSSDYFMGGILTYSNELKQELLDVPAECIQQFGAVSSQTVEHMASIGRERLGVDLCISTSGIAGPGGGSEEKPVGTVWIGIAFGNEVFSRSFSFGDNRERNIQMTVLAALNLVRCHILGVNTEKK